jgi:hypothetical protein
MPGCLTQIVARGTNDYHLGGPKNCKCSSRHIIYIDFDLLDYLKFKNNNILPFDIIEIIDKYYINEIIKKANLKYENAYNLNIITNISKILEYLRNRFNIIEIDEGNKFINCNLNQIKEELDKLKKRNYQISFRYDHK